MITKRPTTKEHQTQHPTKGFSHLLSRYVLCTYCVPEPTPATGIAVNEMPRSLPSRNGHSTEGRENASGRHANEKVTDDDNFCPRRKRGAVI